MESAPGGSTVNKNDVTSPSALLFVDALGETLPFKSSFTYKELSDFCRREGIINLAGVDNLTERELLSIARKISTVTNGHVKINPEPLRKTSKNRTPLSKVDMEVADYMANVSKCRRCQAKTDYRLYCDDCRKITAEILHGKPSPHKPKIKEKKDIKMGAQVSLKDGSQVHVVEKNGSNYVGMADDFSIYSFVESDVVKVNNLDDPIFDKTAYTHCPVCGEEMREYDQKCRVCKYNRDVPAHKWDEAEIDWGGMGD